MPAATAAGEPTGPAPLTKRKRSMDAQSALPPSPSTEFDPPNEQPAPSPPSKRIRPESECASWPRAVFSSYSASCTSKPDGARLGTPPSPPASVHDGVDIDAVKDIVQYQFSHEILVKHNELRLIEQEMAKCQIALEQLRRCHLIPYPTDCPTPEQMLDIASGRGIHVRPRPGATVPKWSPPFGVVDGPYARHYAKWLIPDPVFDGPLANWPGLAPPARSSKSYATADARATRNSFTDSSKARASRGVSGQKLQSLSNGYPQPKDRVGPCVLKRSDGKVVKLVCTDCHRDNFSSTQGFINHCRIAHKRDYKSHDEAAIHCGHPIEVDTTAAPPPAVSSKKTDAAARGSSSAVSVKAEATPAAILPKAVPASISIPPAPTALPGSALVTPLTAGAAPGTAVPGHVYTLARADTDAANSVLERIHSSYETSSTAPTAASGSRGSTDARASAKGKKASVAFVGSDKTPFLSRFLEKKEFGGDLGASVEDAKEVTDINTASWYADEGYELDMDSPSSGSPPPSAAKRGPVRLAQPSAFPASFDGTGESTETSRPGSSKSASSSSQMPFGRQMVDFVTIDDAMDVDLSPIPSASNNAPSLVSDDGEYDDSDDGSASETSDTDMDTVSDIAEINTDEDEDQTHDTPRPMRRHSGSVKLKKDDSKHVSFVSPVKGSNGRHN
ncbi:hypothetical protein SBRCBS47491_001778 [Sporothrix bragantina]|uniref:AHC1-like C2H2 zinc-finger domain-containing protein n=1 Tax=Sporothrix bragantina TaxID=671064 RepID=A0ABP0B1B6_9PEZI